MLVDINLLPKKEPSKTGFVLLMFMMLLFVIIGSSLFYWQYSLAKENTQKLEAQILKTREATATAQVSFLNTASTSSTSELETVVKWADDFPVDTVPVLRHLISLLPNRGFFQSFEYSEEEIMTVAVQFDTSREAASYLKQLTESKWIKEAELSSLTTLTIEEEEDEEETDSSATAETILPRYVGIYEITVDHDEIKKIMKAQSETSAEEEEDSE